MLKKKPINPNPGKDKPKKTPRRKIPTTDPRRTRCEGASAIIKMRILRLKHHDTQDLECVAAIDIAPLEGRKLDLITNKRGVIKVMGVVGNLIDSSRVGRNSNTNNLKHVFTKDEIISIIYKIIRITNLITDSSTGIVFGQKKSNTIIRRYRLLNRLREYNPVLTTLLLSWLDDNIGRLNNHSRINDFIKLCNNKNLL